VTGLVSSEILPAVKSLPLDLPLGAVSCAVVAVAADAAMLVDADSVHAVARWTVTGNPEVRSALLLVT